MRLAIISSAWSWPMTRLARGSGQVQHRLDLVPAPCGRPGCRSSRRRREATACASTVGRISGFSPCSSASSACRVFSSASSAARRPRRSIGAGFGRLLRCQPSGAVDRGAPPARSCAAQIEDAARPAPSPPPSGCSDPSDGVPLRPVSALAIVLRRSLDVIARRFLAPDDLQLGLQRLDPLARSHRPRPARRAG